MRLAYWLRDNWMALVSVLLALDAERRLYCGLDWSLTKSGNDGWVLRNEGWLPERDIVIEPSHGVYYDGRRGFTLKHHESEPMVITVSEASGSDMAGVRFLSNGPTPSIGMLSTYP